MRKHSHITHVLGEARGRLMVAAATLATPRPRAEGNFFRGPLKPFPLPFPGGFRKRLDAPAAAPAERRPRARRRLGGRGVAWLAFAVLLCLCGLQLWLHATRASVTYDEPVHTLAGYRAWQCGDYGINPEHPPLLKLIAALPLLTRQLAGPAAPCGAKLTAKTESYRAGTEFVLENGESRVIVPARLAAAGVSLALALLVFLAAWEMFGRAEALVAAAVLVFEPTLLAHGSLVTTDMAFAATAFASVYALYRYRRRPGVGRLLLGGLAAGLMLASKHSAILMLPLLLLVFTADLLLSHLKGASAVRLPPARTLLRHAAASASVCLLALLVLWAAYGFRYAALPGEGKEAVSVVDYMKSTPSPETAGSASGVLIQLIHRARVFPASYTLGLADVVASGSRRTFILGESYAAGQWFYFPVAFAIKSSVALLVLLPLGLLSRRLYRGRSRELLFLLVPALAFFAISLTWRINIGVRHILPVYPLFIVAAAAGACAWARRQRFAAFVLGALLLLHAATTVRAAPNYIAFANAFWGGTENTHRLLDDSNVEWGQNLNLVDEYLAREGGGGDCWISDFGPGVMLRSHHTCRVMPGFVPATANGLAAEPVPEVIEGTVLVSSEVLPPLGGGEYAQFAGVEPVTVLGGSVFVYKGRFEVAQIAALSHAVRAYQQNSSQRFAEALESGRKAVELAPADPRGRAMLGTALANSGRNEEARREYEEAIRLTRANPVYFSPLERGVRRALQFLP